MAVQDTIETLLSEVKHLAKSETVFGDPIIAGETTLIPVSKISMGFAAGGSGKKEGNNGTGGGVQVTPVALVSITNGKVQVHTMDNGSSDISKIIALAPDLIDTITKKLKKGKK
jgi:uncharacterized spore protein YtfJ